MTTLDASFSLKRGKFELHVEMQLPSQGITALLGPSGSGKSSVLRILAGLDRPQHGYINFNNRAWYQQDRKLFVSPQRRRIGMVFQDYALFSHLTAEENIAYGLQGEDKVENVASWLERLHLQEQAQHYPSQLSGGQRQRVALARALATDPEILLLDEPFSAVDASMRQDLRYQLKSVVETAGIPVVIVSHHLEDALLLADNVGVMINGRILQFGSTNEVFLTPNCQYVAKVVGWQNFLPVSVIKANRISGSWGELSLKQEPGIDTAWLAIRPEHLRIATAEQEGIDAVISSIHSLGAIRQVRCRLQDGNYLEMHVSWDEPVPAPGSQVRLQLPLHYVRALPNCVIASQANSKQHMLTGQSPALRAHA